MVTIKTFGDTLEANLARGYLESAGIPAFLLDEQTMGVAWHLSIAIGGVKLQVAEQDAGAAVNLLAELRTPGTTAVADEPGHEEPRHDESPVIRPVDEPLGYESRLDGEEVEIDPTRREQNAERAWRGTVVCFFFPPLELYILWLLIQVWSSDERLGPKARRHALLAALINIPVVMATLFWVRSFLPV